MINLALEGNILVVDDHIGNIKVLTDILMRRGYKVRQAISGEIALKTAKKMPPDLILLDILMPYMDGFQVCQHLKSDPATCDIPIIFISVLEDISNKITAFEIGGVDYITKPFHDEEIVARVETHLKLRKIESDLRAKNDELEKALEENKILKGIIPICCICKKIRDDEGYWQRLEAYIESHSNAKFSHAVCMDCAKTHYPDLF